MNQSYRFGDRQHNGNETLHNMRLVVGDVRLTEAQLAVVIGPKHVDVLAIIGVTAKHHCVRMTKCYLADMLYRIRTMCLG